MLEVNGNIILTPIYQILCDLQHELKLNGNHLLHTIKPPKYTGDIIVSCPVHKNGYEQHPSAGITQQEIKQKDKIIPAGFMYCFTCKAKMSLDNLISYCFGMYDNGEYGRKWLLSHYANFEIENRKQYFTPFCCAETSKQQYISEEELDKYRYIHPYMYKRGLTDELIEKYDIGYQKDFRLAENTKPMECITFPVKDIKGRCIFIVRRAIKQKIYNYSEGINKQIAYLYEAKKYYPDSKELFICESLLNAITLDKILNVPAVALLGTGSYIQYDILKTLPYRKYILCLDNDLAGIKGTIKLIHALAETHLLEIYTIIDKGVDINDLAMLDKEEFMGKVKKQTKEEFMNENASI